VDHGHEIGPLNIDGETRCNFLRIKLICTDKISKFLHQMFGLQQALALMSLVLVYAGTLTIFANFRTFIQLYLIIFYCYIALLGHTYTSQHYVVTLCCNSTSHLYLATLHHTSIPHQCHITTTSLHHIATTSCCSMCQVRCSGHLGLQGQLLRRMHMTMQQVWTVSKVFPTQPLVLLQPESI
jgi:hypothetical protein